MSNNSRKIYNSLVIIFSLLFLVSIDFISKVFLLFYFPNENIFFNKNLVIYKDFLGTSCYLCLTFNEGAAFGLFSQYQSILLFLRILIVLGMLIYLFLLKRSYLLKTSLVLIISGALGNILDFLLYGYVIDFISFKIFSYNFPVFNLADIFISIGTILLISFFLKKK